MPKTGPILPGEKPINSVKPVETEVKPRVIKEVAGLVSVTDIDNSLFIDLKYSTADNFTGKVIYPVTVCLLQKETAQKLMKANTEFKEKGYKLKIWDAYRPVYVQKIFWDIVKDSRFVANPAMGGSIHNRGTAVDLTLLDSYGDELKMPSKFDDFSANAYRNNSKMDSEARKNMNYLTDVMKRNGFKTIDTEWWHFEDSNSSEYKIVDVKLDEFLKKESLPLN
ncbi:MAG: M15 family metallopeptidase [Clostridiaceae bacterium]|nr:M15 family metallopeptidase [Clostridiaceae bacterium]